MTAELARPWWWRWLWRPRQPEPMRVFSPVFPRVLPPVFGPGLSTAAAAAGWWDVAGKTCVAAYQPKGAASLAASYVNLANPGTYDAAPGIAPTWNASDGWTPDGNQYLTTGITITSTAWSVLVRLSDVISAAALAFGAKDANDRRFTILANFGDTIYYEYGDTAGGYLAIASAFSAGVLGMAAGACYRNGIAETGTINTLSVCTVPIYLLGWNTDGIPGGSTTAKVQAFACYADTLTAGEVAMVSAAMAAL